MTTFISSLVHAAFFHEHNYSSIFSLNIILKTPGLCHALNIRNQRLRSSHLSIPMFIGTPCNNRRIVWRRFYLKLGLEQRFGVLNSGSLFSSPPLGGDSRSNLLGLLNPEWKVRGESPRFTQDWRRVRERGVPFPPGVLSTLWEYKGVQFRIF